MKDWFQEWFGAEYLALYPHRDAAEARRAVDLVAAGVDVARTHRVLDLACGAGRHAKLLSERWWTVGLDLSLTLLQAARCEAPAVPLVRGDMRELPFADHAFDLVVNLFTSFGYFENDAQHLRVLAEVSRVTRRGGVFVLDFLNARTVRNTLVPHDEGRIGGKVVAQRRRLSADGRFVEKEIELRGDARIYRERVRLYDVDDLTMMLEESGFAVLRVHGDYAGGEYAEQSQRAIIFAERE